jgi:hypothetical protein
VHLADAEVGPGVEPAALRHLLGAAEQVGGLPRAEPCRGSDPPCGVGHLAGAGQVARGGGAVEVAGVEPDQPAGGVEHVGRGGPIRRGVADGGGEHGGNARLAGEAQHPGGVAETARGALRAVVADHLDGQRAERQQVVPAGQHGAGQVGAPGQQRSAELGTGSEEHGQCPFIGITGTVSTITRTTVSTTVNTTCGKPGDQLGSGHRNPSLTAEVGGGDQTAQP